MSAATARVLAHLHGVIGSGSNVKAKCPAHEDHVASLSVSEGTDGRALVKCHAGCSIGSVLQAAGLQFSDLFATDTAHTEPLTYDYVDADGQLQYQVVRFPPKEFRQRKPDGAGGWIYKMAGVKRLPYRLPELKNVDTVFVVEGEKDANRLWSLGIPATTNCGGAGKWGSAETKAIKSVGVQRVIVLPDNDKPGLNHAEIVATKAKAAGLAASIILLPGLPNHGDVSDWLAGGHTGSELWDIVNATPYVLPAGLVPVPDQSGQWDEEPDAAAFDPTVYHLTDLGAATSFKDRYQHIVRYDHLRGSWLVWDNHYWRPDADEAVYRLGHEHALYMQHAATGIVDYTVKVKTQEWALKLEKRGSVENFLAMAKSMLPIATPGDSWDQNGWLLGCANGIVDLKTGELRPGQHDDFVTQQTAVAYDASATCPRWLLFLEQVFDANLELIDYVHKALGYSMTADMREQCFFVAYGSGANGKSVWLDTLEAVWGSYGHRADMRMFAGHGNDMSNFHLADFRGKRLVFAAETKPNSRMNEHVIKNFTGGETVRVERKYGDPFTIRPCGKIWLGVNHRPRVADDSFGFWRRVRLIPFLRTFTGAADDLTLKATLRAETAGILAWAVQGCLRWQAEGLVVPDVVRAETDLYQATEDPLADFFEQRTQPEPGNVVPFVKLYAAYKSWASDQGFTDRDKLSGKAFGNALARRPIEKIKNNGVVRYRGIRVVDTTLFGE